MKFLRHAGWIGFAVLCCLGAASAPGQESPDKAIPHDEPTNVDEAKLQQKYGGKISSADYKAYQTLVTSLPPDEQRWEHALEQQLGGYYFPIYLKKRIAPDWKADDSEWGFIHDDPSLPRLLIIGDSISRGYTVPARKRLAGKANLHRAPANCSSTVVGLRDLDSWLDQGNGKWDVVVFNFGIHDRQASPEEYAANLQKIIDRLKKTGASLVWCRTTPFGKDLDESSPLNRTADTVMKANGIPAADLHEAVFADRQKLQVTQDFFHFTAEGSERMAQTLADTLEPILKAKKP